MTVHVGIIGCGRIFPRHLESIKGLSKLEAICDIDESKLIDVGVPTFTDYKEMFKVLPPKAMVTIATPNDTHYQIAKDCLNAGFHILIEKPATTSLKQAQELLELSRKVNRNAYVVLQVRYNPSVIALQQALREGLLGEIRGVSLVQRWQRPDSYYEKWYGNPAVSGGILFEVGVHYLDILCILFGQPQAIASYSTNSKHHAFEGSVCALAKLSSGAPVTIESTIAAEPRNLECSISVIGSGGYMKLGGIALDELEQSVFTNPASQARWDKIKEDYWVEKALTPNVYGDHVGSCPNHPKVYEAIASSRGMKLKSALPVIGFIEDLYGKRNNS